MLVPIRNGNTSNWTILFIQNDPKESNSKLLYVWKPLHHTESSRQYYDII